MIEGLLYTCIVICQLIKARQHTQYAKRAIVLPTILPCDAMRKRGLCSRPVSIRLSVRHVRVLYPNE